MSQAGNVRSFVEALYAAEDFNSAFVLLEREAASHGFHGVLYSYIPRLLLDSEFVVEPVFETSQGFSVDYLRHYSEARFERRDPLIKAVNEGVLEPINWRGSLLKPYLRDESAREVLEQARVYGIQNGLTLPLLSSSKGIAGATFISEDRAHFNLQLRVSERTLKLYADLFHSMVIANSNHAGRFVKTLLGNLNKTEFALLRGLAVGKSPATIAVELCRTEKYLEQVMLRIRRKWSNSSKDSVRQINRNQVMYYVGLINLLERQI